MKCYKESRVGKSKFNQNDIIIEFKKVHGNRYNYSKVKFLTNNEKIIIVCSKHGEFLQAPKQHKKGAGCPACAGNIKFNTETYLKELKNRGFWNDNYDYSEVNYVSMKKLIKIRDKTTNIYHLANPWTIINKGSGLDIKSLSYMGYSWGSVTSNILLAIENRVASAAIFVGGLMLQKSRREIESHLYVRRIEIPILHIVGKLDGIFEFEDSFIPWNELIGTNEKDKTIIILENVGHGLPKDLMIENHLKFLKKYN
jgi:hypothetical protein